MVVDEKKMFFVACGISAALTAGALCAAVFAEETVTIEGRLSLLAHGQEQWLVLLARDGQSYKVTGRLETRLKKILDSRGEKNLVTVSGVRSDKSLTPCLVTRDLVHDEKGNKTLKTDVRCITYFTFEAAQILGQRVSDQAMPAPLRDAQQEKIVGAAATEQKPLPPIIGEISGSIIVTTPRKPIKSIEVQSRDKERVLTVLIKPETRIVKIIGGSEPVVQAAEGLKVGQEVTVVYKRRELKTEADYITITKE